MKKINYIIVVIACLSLNSCGLYKKYQRPESIQVDNLLRDVAITTDTTSIADIPYTEFFTDPQLQSLITQGLAANTDMKNTLLAVQQAEAALLPAKLAFFPSLAFAPQGTVSSFDYGKASFTYQLPIVAGWQIDAFGSLLNAKRGAKVSLEQAKTYQQAVQSRLIAGIATCYYSLLMLDQQLSIAEGTALKWKENVETMKAMKIAAMTNEAAVAQSEAAYYQVQLSLPDLKRNIREVENQLCSLLGQAPQPIQRSTLQQQTSTADISKGIPLQILSRRPDVRASELSLASAYYGTKQAQAAFYPNITLSGSAGWTNSAGGAIFNPAEVIASAVGSLTQPIFQNGALRARLKYAKFAQEQAANSFQQTLLDAATEVSNALFAYETSLAKQEMRTAQVAATQRANDATKELFKAGNSSTYLEVINAEQNLLQARLAEAADRLDRLNTIVTLYQALGGGGRVASDSSHSDKTGE